VGAEDEHRQLAFREDEAELPPECAGGLSQLSCLWRRIPASQEPRHPNRCRGLC
jgi:hypothetical protein